MAQVGALNPVYHGPSRGSQSRLPWSKSELSIRQSMTAEAILAWLFLLRPSLDSPFSPTHNSDADSRATGRLARKKGVVKIYGKIAIEAA